MAMAKGHWRRSRSINDSYQHRYRRHRKDTPTGPPGTPRGVHVRPLTGKKKNNLEEIPLECRCGGCNPKLK